MEVQARDHPGRRGIKKKKLKEDMSALQQHINRFNERVNTMTHPCDRREGLRQISDARERLGSMAGQYSKLP